MARSDPLETRLEEAVQRELRGEPVRWSGRPSPWRAFAQEGGLLLMGVMWTPIASMGLGVFLIRTLPDVLGPPLDWSRAAVVGAFALYLVVFVLIGVCQLLFPLLRAWHAHRTIYALSDKRLITLCEGWKTHVQTVRPGRIHDIECKERWDGSGDLRLTIDPKDEVEMRLVGIPEVRKVEGMLTRFKVRGGKPP